MSFQLIKPSDLIKRLREFSDEYMPALSSRIAGAAGLDEVEDKTRLSVPALFVSLADNGVEVEGQQTGFQGNLDNQFDIILVLENTDRRAQEAEEISIAFREFLLAVLSGWKPVASRGNGLIPLGDALSYVDRSRYIRTYSFLQLAYFDSNEDGLGMLGDYDDLPWLKTIEGAIKPIDFPEDTKGFDFEVDKLDEQ